MSFCAARTATVNPSVARHRQLDVFGPVAEQQLIAPLSPSELREWQGKELGIGHRAGAVRLGRADVNLKRYEYRVLLDAHAPPDRVDVPDAERGGLAASCLSCGGRTHAG